MKAVICTRTLAVPDFFIDNYDHPIFEGGGQLKDMIYLKRRFNQNNILYLLSRTCTLRVKFTKLRNAHHRVQYRTNADGSLNEEYCTAVTARHFGTRLHYGRNDRTLCTVHRRTTRIPE